MRRASIAGGILAALLVAGGLVFTVQGAWSHRQGPTSPAQVGPGSFAGQSSANTLDELVNGRNAERSFLTSDLIVRARILKAETAAISFSPPPSPPPWKRQGRAQQDASPAAPEPTLLATALTDYRTDYTVRVSGVIRGTLPVHELTVAVFNPPVVSGRTNQFGILPPLPIDEEYVLLLIQRPDGRYAPVGPQGVLLIRDGVIEPVMPNLPVVEALRGQPVADVIRQIQQADQHP